MNAEALNEGSPIRSLTPDWLAACAAQALALRAIIRYRKYREKVEFEGGVGVEEGLLLDLSPNGFHLGITVTAYEIVRRRYDSAVE